MNNKHNKTKRAGAEKKPNTKLDTLLEKKGRRKKYYLFLILLSLLLSFAGLVLIKNYSGFASFGGEAGYIYEVNLYYEGNADMWSGLYGIALRFDAYPDDWQVALFGAQIKQQIFLFTCLQPGIKHEIYASLANKTDIDWDTLQPGTADDINTFLGLSSTDYFSATNMFTETINISVGPNSYVIPATYTLVYNSSNTTRYPIGILKDGLGNLVFVSPINDTIDFCYYGGACNYQMLLPVRNGSGHNETYNFFADPFDTCSAGELPEIIDFTEVTGRVTDSSTDNPIENALVVIGNYANYTNVNGYYVIRIPIDYYHIFALKSGYDTYHNTANFSQPNITYTHNIALSPKKIGDYTRPPSDNNEREVPTPALVEQPTVINAVAYLMSIAEINRKIRQGNFVQEVIYFLSVVEYGFDILFDIQGEVSEIIDMDLDYISLDSGNQKKLTLTIFGKGEPRILKGNLSIRGVINNTIPITIEILDKELLPVEALIINVLPYKQSVDQESDFRFRVNLNNLLTDQQYPIRLTYTIQDVEGNTTYWTDEENVFILTSITRIKSLKLPKEMVPGDYIITVSAEYLGLSSASTAIFEVVEPFYMYRLFGILPLWMIFLAFLIIAIFFIVFTIWKRQAKARKKYKMAVDFGDLPKMGPFSLFVGKVAETPRKTFFDMTQLKMHSIIAGSTGSGKSFTAQVMAEELLEKNVAVIVFDPTAQWTGMLRKCKDKAIIHSYKYFDMKQEEAKPFNGGLRQITNPFEEIELGKYIKPGEIQVFAINRLEPEDIEVFVSNTIRQVFRQNFGESKELKLVLVYDEVHRLLPKFGGSGIGFLQLERGLREFRKWGIGIMMISHVLNDFVDQIRANISTQIQMKTRDENDLERIRIKHGQNIFRSMVKTKVGTGLVVNADYNRGEPYFVEFRPIKHDLMRLSEEEIQKYNEYNKKVDQIEYEIQQLEELKQDTFNLNLEMKLLVKKLKEGSFHVVDIYLEEIDTELEKTWKKIKKKPKQKQIRLIDKKEIEKEIKKAEEERKIFLAKQEKENAKMSIVSAQNASPQKDPPEKEFSRKVDLSKALNFDNGASVQSLEELFDAISGMTDEVFTKHVNAKKNEVADWVGYALKNKSLANKIRQHSKRELMLEILKSFREQAEWFGEKK